jgi:hypothetical protein
LNILAAGASIATLSTILVLKAVDGEISADSPLLIAELVLFMVVATGPVQTHIVSRVKLVSGYPEIDGHQARRLVEPMEDFIRRATPCTAHNEGLLRFRTVAADILLVCFAFNVLLLALWALSI